MATRIATITSSTDFIDEWESYFSYLTSVLNECRRHRETDSVEKVSYFCETLERFIVSTDCLLVTANDAVHMITYVELVIYTMLIFWRLLLAKISQKTLRLDINITVFTI